MGSYVEEAGKTNWVNRIVLIVIIALFLGGGYWYYQTSKDTVPTAHAASQ